MSSQTFQLHNPGNSPIAIELSMHTRELQPDGSEVREPANDLFSIFPGRVILDPGERRTVRVRWIGPAEIDSEQAFRLLAEQLPVNLTGDEAAPESGGVITIMYRYLAAVYVTPERAEADVHAEVIDATNGETRIRISNSGSQHRLLNSLELIVQYADGSSTLLTSADLPGLAGTNLLAGSWRDYPISDSSSSEVTDVSLILPD
nr:fimbria/pilus periplasmic chaperone [Spirochaeta africana]